MWSTPSPSTSKRVHPVSFSIGISYILYIMYLTSCYVLSRAVQCGLHVAVADQWCSLTELAL
jgi:hypothetical protein